MAPHLSCRHVERLEQELRVLRSGISDEEWQARVAQQNEEAAANFAAAQSWAVHGRAAPTDVAHVDNVVVRGDGRRAQEAQPQEASPAPAQALQKQPSAETAKPATQHRSGSIVYTNPQGASPGTVTAGRAGVSPPQAGDASLAPSSGSPALGPPRRVAKGVIHWFSSPKAAPGTAAVAAKTRAGVSPSGSATAPLMARAWHDDDGVVVRVSPAARAAAGDDEPLPRRAPLTSNPGPSRRAVWRHNMHPMPAAVVRESVAASANPMSPPATAQARKPSPRGSAGLSRALAAQHRHYTAMAARLGLDSGADDVQSTISDSMEHATSAARNRRDAYARFVNGEYDAGDDDVQSDDGRRDAMYGAASDAGMDVDGDDDDAPMPEPMSPVPASMPRVPEVHVSYLQPRKSGAQPWRMMGSRPPVGVA